MSKKLQIGLLGKKRRLYLWNCSAYSACFLPSIVLMFLQYSKCFFLMCVLDLEMNGMNTLIEGMAMVSFE